MATVFQRLAALLDELPGVGCRGLCQASCSSLSLTSLEAAWIERRGGRRISYDEHRQCCSVLDEDGRCSAHAHRPLICRLWGVVDTLTCPHGCRPERVVTSVEAAAMLTALEQLDDRGRQYLRIGPEPDGDVTRAMLAAIAEREGLDGRTRDELMARFEAFRARGTK